MLLALWRALQPRDSEVTPTTDSRALGIRGLEQCILRCRTREPDSGRLGSQFVDGHESFRYLEFVSIVGVEGTR